MKNPYLILLHLPPLLFFRCKKDSDLTKTSCYIKYKPEGVATTNTKLNYSWILPNSTIANMIDFQMYSNTNDNKDGLGIKRQRLGGVASGAYNGQNGFYIAIIDYLRNQGETNEGDLINYSLSTQSS